MPLSSISVQDLTGLEPEAWICIDSGFSREEFKDFLLNQGIGFVKEALMSPEELCIKIIQIYTSRKSKKQVTVLGSLSRQEILRALLSERRISNELPELKQMKRRGRFYKKLDRSLQAVRKTFSHLEEERVLEERLVQALGEDSRRTECRKLNLAYETWLEASEFYDFALLMRSATQLLKNETSSRGLPQSIFLYRATPYESLEQEFWEALGQRVELKKMGPAEELPPKTWPELQVQTHSVTWECWHTHEDASESLAERLSHEHSFENQVILIPDFASIRRSVVRALEFHQVPLKDPRDPMRVRLDEKFKWALLPLQSVARQFERVSVIAWMRKFCPQKETAKFELEINARGIRKGLDHYAGGSLDALYLRLKELSLLFGGKKKCHELAEAHLFYLSKEMKENSSDYTVFAFFEKFWKDFEEDLCRVTLQEMRGPLLFWLVRLQARLEDTPPPIDPLRPRSGVSLHRLGQAMLTLKGRIRSLWILGAPPDWFKGEGTGDLWFSERARECLSTEFSVRSKQIVRQERIQMMNQWIQNSDHTTFLDFSFDWSGKEREVLLPLGAVPIDCGVHPRWQKSYSTLHLCDPPQIELPSLKTLGQSEIRATALDQYSRCAFRGLASSRWKVWDIREPGIDLWAEVRGNILHHAVQSLKKNKSLFLTPSSGSKGDKALDLVIQKVIEEALNKERPRGLLQGKRLSFLIRSELFSILKVFCEKEKEYMDRSGARLLQSEGPPLRLEYDLYSILGVPDRIDIHPDGIFIIDYKSASTLAKGNEMVQKGYRLQLPFYALAASKMLGKPVLGAQYVELNQKGGRGQGIFFKKWNGKESGCLTDTRSRLSVLEDESETVWHQCAEQLKKQSFNYFQGHFEARPKKGTECRTCPFGDLCGRRRFSLEETPDAT